MLSVPGEFVDRVISQYKHGVKASTISDKLKKPRKEINSYLYANKDKYYKDDKDKWHFTITKVEHVNTIVSDGDNIVDNNIFGI